MPPSTDPSESLAVSLDRDGRVSAVQVLSLPDELRRPEALATAVDRAYRRALLAAAGDKRRDVAGGPPPRAVGAPSTPPPRPSRRDGMALGPSATTLERNRARVTDHDLTPTGISANDCVRVTLYPASSNGRLEADPGWLSGAAAAKVGSAITEAFTAAYERGHR